MTRLHLGVVGTAVLSIVGIIACALTHTPIPEGLTAAATTAVGALAGITVPTGAQQGAISPQEATSAPTTPGA